ncbi:MAG: GWxTD domain-containing protein [Acidobacteriota bacterium]|nr:MAG: GWxTD domain-containing protein [Acidobacteriota bacterium]
MSLLVGVFFSAGLSAADRYEQWLDEEVVWIVGKEEKKRFEQLKTDEERDAFIVQFWKDRDPTPETPKNEYMEEHYVRLKEVNELFHESNLPGWKTDRGRIYIIHGPPNSRNSQAETEIWTYNSNPNARYYQGSLMLQFQRGGSTFQQRGLNESAQGQSRMQQYQMGPRNPQSLFAQHDRWRLVAAGPGLGMGGTIRTSAGETDSYIGDLLRSPGDVLEEKKADEARRQETWRNLDAAVNTSVAFGKLDLDIVPLSLYREGNHFLFFDLEIPSTQLQYEKVDGGDRAAKVDLLCEVKDQADDYIVDKIDETFLFLQPRNMDEQPVLRYSDRFRLPAGRYHFRCVLQDVETKRMGLEEFDFEEKPAKDKQLAMSSLLLTQDVHQVNEPEFIPELYPLAFGELRFPIRPTRPIDPNLPLYLYFEVYNLLKTDGVARQLVFNYKLYNDEQIFLKLPMQAYDASLGDSLALMFDVSKLPVGEYSFLLKIIDTETKEYTMRLASFQIASP